MSRLLEGSHAENRRDIFVHKKNKETAHIQKVWDSVKNLLFKKLN